MSTQSLLRRGIVLALAVVISAAPTSVALGTAGRVDWATTFVAGQQRDDGSFESSFGTPHAATADAVLSLVASGQGADEVDAAIEWLEDNVAGADTLGKKAKVVLAAVAAGRDPRDFGGVDLVDQIESTLLPDGRYASDPFSQVFDQALALLALDAAGAAIPRVAVQWLAEAQCPDGGWQFDQPRRPGENRRCKDADDPNDFTETDTNTTGLVLQALAAVPRSVGLAARPFEWLRDRRDRMKGGWGFDRTFSLTDSASTAIVIQAFAAFDRRPPKGVQRALRELQRYCARGAKGGFSRGWTETDSGKIKRERGQDIGNTVAAVLGLLEAPLPIAPKPFLKPMPESLPCDPIS